MVHFNLDGTEVACHIVLKSLDAYIDVLDNEKLNFVSIIVFQFSFIQNRSIVETKGERIKSHGLTSYLDFPNLLIIVNASILKVNIGIKVEKI